MGDAGQRHWDDQALMALVARRHYLDGVSKVEVAEELSISRFKVTRLLQQARESGVVVINVDTTGFPDIELSERLTRALGLEHSIVIRSHGKETDILQQVGAAAAQFLRRTLKEGEVVGFSWGRTLNALAKNLDVLPPVTVVQLTGIIGHNLSRSPVEIIRMVASGSGGEAQPIFAPLLLESPETAASLRRQPEVSRAMDKFKDLTTAILSVGSWQPPLSQLRDIIDPAERDGLRDVRADIAGLLIRQDGSFDETVTPRCLTISAEELSRVPQVIVVAGGIEKAQAVLATVRSGLVSSLITDHTLALEILRTTETA